LQSRASPRQASGQSDAAPGRRCRRRLYSDFVWRLSLPDGARLPYHRFRQGDSVVLAGGGQRAGRGRSTGGSSDSEGEGGGPGGDGGGDSGGGGAARGGSGSGLEGTVLGVEREGLLVAVSKEASEELGALPPGGHSWRGSRGGGGSAWGGQPMLTMGASSCR
jgi:hypothetical protein